MKRILLASTALVGLAGAASAEITFSGDAELFYTFDGEQIDDAGTVTSDDNLEWSADFNIRFSQELDNGITAGVDWEIDFVDDNQGNDLSASDFLLSLTSEQANLFFGDTEFAAVNVFSGVTDMAADNFSEADGEDVLRGEVTAFGWNVQISTFLLEDGQFLDATGADVAVGEDELEQLSVGVQGDIGPVNVILAYQEDFLPDGAESAVNGDFNTDEIFAVALSATFAGADITLAYADNEVGDSTGIEVSYPVTDAVTITGFYVAETVDADDASAPDGYGVTVDYVQGPIVAQVFYSDTGGEEDYGLDVDYDLGNGITLKGGYAEGDGSDDGFYVGAAYDLGAGAELRFIYVDADNLNTDDEYFGDDDPEGATLSLSFAF